MEAYLDWQKKSGGIKLNNVIEEYRYVAAGKQIKAGDLVNYINGVASKTDYGESVDTQLSSETNSGQTISAVQLDENRIFIAHSYSSSRHLYGVVVTVNGTNIEVGTDTAIESYTYEGYTISACLLSKDKVFIAHSRSSDYNLYGIVCTISGTQITSGSNTDIKTGSEQGYSISAVALDENRVFIAFAAGSSTRSLRGIVASISGTTITIGSEATISSVKYSGYKISTCLLPNGNVFIAHSYDSSYYLYGIVCSISGTTITNGSDIALVSSANAGYTISIVALDEHRVFIAHSGGSNYYLYGIVCSISGTTITKGTDTQLSATTYAGIKTSTLVLDDNRVFIAHSHTKNTYYLYGIVCEITGTTIIAGTDTPLEESSTTSSSGYAISSLLLQNGTIFIAHSYDVTSYYLNAQLFSIDENNIPTNNIVITEYEQQVTPAIEPPFNAIALSDGVGAPEYVEGEVTKTGDIFPTSWNVETTGTKYKTSDGYELEASGFTGNNYANLACDGNGSTYWESNEGKTHWLTIKLPKAIKITKMATYINTSYTSLLLGIQIQGSNDNNVWDDLYTRNSSQSSSVGVTINNPGYYQYYRFNTNFSSSAKVKIYSIGTMEYIVKEQIPSTEHNEQVKIARVYKEVEVTKTDNIFAKTWNVVTEGTKYSSDDGYIITASSATQNQYCKYAFDNNTSTTWTSSQQADVTLQMECPNAVRISKMKTRISASIASDLLSFEIQGSKDLSEWISLYKSETYQTALTEIELSNVDSYKYYRIKAQLSDVSINLFVYEWQVSEYIVKEVIQ